MLVLRSTCQTRNASQEMPAQPPPRPIPVSCVISAPFPLDLPGFLSRFPLHHCDKSTWQETCQVGKFDTSSGFRVLGLSWRGGHSGVRGLGRAVVGALPIHIMGDGEWLESSQVINLQRPTDRPNFQQAPQPPKTVPSSKDEQGPTEDILDLNLNTSLLVSFSGHFFLCPGVINVVKRGKSSKNMKTCCLTVLQPQQSILESEGTVAGNIRLTCVCYYV